MRPRGARARRDAEAPAPRRGREDAGAAVPTPSADGAPWAFAALVTAMCVLTGVTFVIADPDQFQHLLVGRVIWATHAVPTTQIWTWPTYGTPDLTPSWLFRALLWPVWQAGGVMGLFVWRWVTTLAAFALAWLVARRLGARGMAPLLVVALCALVYRQRAFVRPESLANLLLLLELWILESRRRGGPDRSRWLIAIAWAWANIHLSYWMGFAVLAAYALDDLRRRAAGVRALGIVALGMAAVSFLDPSGWRALWQPFEFVLWQRHEPIFASIAELRPVVWGANLTNGLPLLMLAWPLLVIRRVIARRSDLAETVLCAMFTVLALASQRLLGTWALVACPFVSAGVAEIAASWRAPAALRPAWSRALLAAALCVAISVPEWRRPGITLGFGLREARYPMGACDFVLAHGVRGPFFNNFASGGTMLWRLWPERDRLPFMDIHQSGGREIRAEYQAAVGNADGWAALEARWRFDAVLLDRAPGLLDVASLDPTFATVFMDDAGALLLRRGGPQQALIDSFEYRLLPPGEQARLQMRAIAARDPDLRPRLVAELERARAGSPLNAIACGDLGFLRAVDGRFAEARALLRHSLAVEPNQVGAHETLGMIDLTTGAPREALREFEAERAMRAAPAGIDLRIGQAAQRAGDVARARAAYRREIARGPYAAEAADSLRAMGLAP